ncbi:MAG: ribose 5-phosphate isomerase B [Flavobacteriales bacterium]
MDKQWNTPVRIASDHAGFEMKEEIIQHLHDLGFETMDLGPVNAERVDYPDYAHALANAMNTSDCGILLCGSANGVAITANKHQHIRAAIAWNSEIASLARQHNDANVLCLPARFLQVQEAKEIVSHFMNSVFEGGRHAQRVDKISCI